MEIIWLDLRHTCRMLRRSPAFTLAAVLTLALGIGANTAIFSVVESVLLRPLPFKNASALVQLWNTYPPTVPQGPFSAGDYRDFREQSRTFAAMGAFIEPPRNLTMTAASEPERLEMRYATSGLFPMLGIQPIAGRTFTPAEDNPGTPLSLVISERLWRSRFGSNPAILGNTILLDGRGYTLVGIVPQVQLAPTTDLWEPIGEYETGSDPYRFHEFNIIGRLKPGTTIEQARAELITLNERQQRAFPATHKNFGVQITSLQDPSARKMRTALLILFGAVALVLLVACANFANLLMARNVARQRELAARVALGASQWRLLHHLITESVLLALLGGTAGLAIAEAGLRVMRQFVPPDLAPVNHAGLNLWVLGFALALSFVSGIGSGLIPFFQTSRLDLHTMLKDGARTIGPSRREAIRSALVVSEIALAVVLLTAAGLLIRSFQRLMAVDPGFRPDHVLALEIAKPRPSPSEQIKLPYEQRVASLRQDSAEYEALIQRIEALPDVKAAGGVSVLPLGVAMRTASRFLIEGQSAPADGARPVAEIRSVSAGYFAAMGIPLLRGRLFDAHDYAGQNIVVNQAFAERFWPGADAVGKRVNFCSLSAQPCWSSIIGVVGNVHQYGLEAAPTFDSYSAAGWVQYTVIRTSSDPVSIAQAVTREVHKSDAGLPVTHVVTLDKLISESVASRRLSTFLLGLFAALALLLAAVGVFAVMSYAVRLRTSEIAIRAALGAQPRNIWWLILNSGARIVGAGIVIGVAGALALTKLLSALLYDVTATDPVTFAGAALFLAGVALVACYVPARQAMRIDPASALRLD